MFERWASALFVAMVCLVSPALASSWPEIPRAEWEMTAAPGAANAPGVVLLDRGRLVVDDEGRSSFLEVYTRMKVLNEQGRSLATVSISSSRYLRLHELEARTHLPDGRVVDLSADARFEARHDTYFQHSVHSVALPAVEVGAIVEFRYKLYFDSVFFTEPWYFQSRLPTLRSEFSAEYPSFFSFAPVRYSPQGLAIQTSSDRTPRVQRASFAVDRAPAVADEPYRLPFHDLSAWVLVVVQDRFYGSRREVDYFRTWESTLELMRSEGYVDARHADNMARQRAKALAGNEQSPRARAEILYRFVRDGIADRPWPDVTADGGWTVDETLREKAGSSIDKALLLQAMLDAVKVRSQVGWVRTRSSGRAHENVPTPYQFDHTLLVVELDGEQVFLDPTDSDLPFGELPYELEGVRCLLVDGKNPVWVSTPVRPVAGNLRSARLELELRPDGRLTGIGRMALSGHWSWKERKAAAGRDPRAYWREWLQDQLPGFDLEAIEVMDEGEKLATLVTWRLVQVADGVAGDEVSFNPAVPLGLARAPLLSSSRRTPVHLDFADVGQVEVSLRWPTDWQLATRPELHELVNGVGSLETSLEVGPGRELVARRKFTVRERTMPASKSIAEIRDLFAKVAANDAEELVLVKL